MVLNGVRKGGGVDMGGGWAKKGDVVRRSPDSNPCATGTNVSEPRESSAAGFGIGGGVWAGGGREVSHERPRPGFYGTGRKGEVLRIPLQTGGGVVSQERPRVGGQ